MMMNYYKFTVLLLLALLLSLMTMGCDLYVKQNLFVNNIPAKVELYTRVTNGWRIYWYKTSIVHLDSAKRQSEIDMNEATDIKNKLQELGY